MECRRNRQDEKPNNWKVQTPTLVSQDGQIKICTWRPDCYEFSHVTMQQKHKQRLKNIEFLPPSWARLVLVSEESRVSNDVKELWCFVVHICKKNWLRFYATTVRWLNVSDCRLNVQQPGPHYIRVCFLEYYESCVRNAELQAQYLNERNSNTYNTTWSQLCPEWSGAAASIISARYGGLKPRFLRRGLARISTCTYNS